MATVIRLNQSIVNDDAPRLRQVITSDDFSGTGEIVGSMSSAAFGGTPMLWEGTPGGWTRAQGGIYSPQGSSNEVLEMSGLPADMTASYTVVELPDAGYVAVSIRMKNVGNRVVFGLTNTGALWIENRVDGVTTRSSVAHVGVRGGDRLEFIADGNALISAVNGIPALSYDAQISGEGIMRLSTYPVINAVIDDLVITTA